MMLVGLVMLLSLPSPPFPMLSDSQGSAGAGFSLSANCKDMLCPGGQSL